METKKEETPKTTKQHEKELSAAIMLAVELDGAFKMFSYRVIAPEQFFERTRELTEVFKYSVSQQKRHEDLDNQLDLIEEIEKQK